MKIYYYLKSEQISIFNLIQIKLIIYSLNQQILRLINIAALYPVNDNKQLMEQKLSDQPFNLKLIQQSLLQNEAFLSKISLKISQLPVLKTKSSMSLDLQPQSENSLKCINKYDLDLIITEISELLNDLISQKLEYELNQIIEENKNILLQIKENLMNQQKQSSSSSNQISLENDRSEMPFSDVHKLIAEEKKKFEIISGGGINDADVEKSVSTLVEWKFDSMEEKVVNLEKRIKSMEDKYETNLKSIWNVLSMTQSALFEFIGKEKQKEKEKKQILIKETNQNSFKNHQKKSKKSHFFKLW